jgi:hypothetical protein
VVTSAIARLVVMDPPPSALCPPDLLMSTDLDQCTRSNVTYAATSTDNCPGVTVACEPPSGSMFAVGTNRVNCTGTDASGNTANCTFTVTVLDRDAPSMTCSTDVTVCTEAGDTAVHLDVSASDNCPQGLTLTCIPPLSSRFPLGTTPVVCTASDAAGNSNRCDFAVTVLSLGDVRLVVEQHAEELWFSWPMLACTNYSLQQASRVSLAEWFPVNAAVTVRSNRNQVVLPRDGEGRFFRLKSY